MASILLSGSVGAGGSFAILGFVNVTITGNADLTLSAPQQANYFVKVASDGASLAVRQVIAPLNEGNTYVVENATSEGFAITFIGSSGTGVSIPPGAMALVVTDGTNYFGTLLGASATVFGTWTADVLPGASPYTPLAGQIMIAVNTSTGPVTVKTPANPYDGQPFCVKPTAASATPITVTATSGTIENPSNAGNFGASGLVPGQGSGAWWKWRASDSKWIGMPGGF